MSPPSPPFPWGDTDASHLVETPGVRSELGDHLPRDDMMRLLWPVVQVDAVSSEEKMDVATHLRTFQTHEMRQPWGPESSVTR